MLNNFGSQNDTEIKLLPHLFARGAGFISGKSRQMELNESARPTAAAWPPVSRADELKAGGRDRPRSRRVRCRQCDEANRKISYRIGGEGLALVRVSTTLSAAWCCV